MLTSPVISRFQPFYIRRIGLRGSSFAPLNSLISFPSINLPPLCAPFETQVPYFQSLAASFSKTWGVGDTCDGLRGCTCGDSAADGRSLAAAHPLQRFLHALTVSALYFPFSPSSLARSPCPIGQDTGRRQVPAGNLSGQMGRVPMEAL